MARQTKSLPSQLDEIGGILGAIASTVPCPVPSVAAFQQLGATHQPGALQPPHSACQQTENSKVLSSNTLDWSSLPSAVDADSTSMGVSTRKLSAKKQAKQRPVDAAKVQARVARKRAQVESFWLVLQPLLQATGHTNESANVLPAPPCKPCSSCSPAAVAPAPCQSPGHQQLSQGAGSPAQQQQQQPGPHPPQVHCSSKSPAQPERPLQQQLQPQPPLALHIVDFGCGTGNLLLPLAALLPGCHFTGVDMKPAALQRLQQRAAAAGLTNVSVFPGMIEAYEEPFDVALALHACGNATDHVLQMAVDRAAAFVVSPCCVGKLRFSLTGGSSFHSQPVTWTPTAPGDRPVQQGKDWQQQQQQQQVEQAGQQQQQQLTQADAALLGPPPTHQHPQPHQQQHQHQGAPGLSQQQQQEEVVVLGGATRLRHPRSDWLLAQLPDPQKNFRIMAKVADISHAPADTAELSEALKHRTAVADTCKRFVELDRCAAAAEAGYAVGLFKVLQSHTMAKNDLLIGLPMTATAAAAAVDTVAGPPTQDVQGQAVAAPGNSGGGAQGRDCAGVVRRCLCQCGDVLASSGLLYTSSSLTCCGGNRAA